jgi:hypothetical protein
VAAGAAEEVGAAALVEPVPLAEEVPLPPLPEHAVRETASRPAAASSTPRVGGLLVTLHLLVVVGSVVAVG